MGEYNEDQIKTILVKDSQVPRKHGKGGQSEQRFKRARREALKHWFRDSAELIRDERRGREIRLGVCQVYTKQIKEALDTDTRKSVIEIKSVPIDDNCLWTLIGKSRYN